MATTAGLPHPTMLVEVNETQEATEIHNQFLKGKPVYRCVRLASTLSYKAQRCLVKKKNLNMSTCYTVFQRSWPLINRNCQAPRLIEVNLKLFF